MCATETTDSFPFVEVCANQREFRFAMNNKCAVYLCEFHVCMGEACSRLKGICGKTMENNNNNIRRTRLQQLASRLREARQMVICERRISRVDMAGCPAFQCDFTAAFLSTVFLNNAAQEGSAARAHCFSLRDRRELLKLSQSTSKVPRDQQDTTFLCFWG